MRRKTLSILFIGLLFLGVTGWAQKRNNTNNILKLLLTGNLEGRFEWESSFGVEKTDPLLLLARKIREEKAKGRMDLYLDLGNAFWPGALSRYSFGSVMMDFFEFTGARATLLSSQDIRIGLDNLQFLQGGKETLFLSANILKNKEPVFAPYFIHQQKDLKIAFVGLSSAQALLDVAERRVFELKLEEASLALESLFMKLQGEAVDRIILLSGFPPYMNVRLLKKFPQINLIIAGGDDRGSLFEESTERISLSDGRSILFLAKKDGFYELNYNLDQLKIEGYDFKTFEAIVPPAAVGSEVERDYEKRLAIWKDKFKEDQEQVLFSLGKASWEMSSQKLAWLLRAYFSAEIAFVQKDVVFTTKLEDKIRKIDLLSLVQDEYSLLTFTLKGSEVKRVIASLGESWLISGSREGKIQGYLIEDKRNYRFASTQAGFEAIRKLLARELEYKNSWKTLYELIVEDFQGERVLLERDESFLGTRFISTLDVMFSFFYNYSNVEKGKTIPTPAGQRTLSYTQWGYEAQAVWQFYNQWHQFVLTPYAHFVEEENENQEKKFIYNLFRGTLVYNLNLNSLIKPYQKSQLDTVVKEVEGLRPTVLRETIGAFITTSMVEGKIGIGFEKPIQDPVEKPRYGLEAIFKLNWPIWDYITLQSSIDLFISRNEAENISNVRSEMQNALLFKVGEELTFTFKHKWYYFYSQQYEERYSFTQYITSLDWRTDWRLF